MNVSVIIPAAGRSDRYGPRDKLAEDLGGRPLLVRTVELFTKRDEVRSILVAGPPEGTPAFDDFRDRYAPTLGFHGAQVVPGGAAARWETVRLALAAVPDDATHVAVHDAARPAAFPELLSRVFEAAETLDAVVPAVPLSGTIKRTDPDALDVRREDDDVLVDSILGDAGKQRIEAHQVLETVDRAGLWEVQTPQVFRRELIDRAYRDAELDGATDDATAVERLGEPVHLVDGDPRNLKVTVPADLALVRAILGVKPEADRPVHKRF